MELNPSAKIRNVLQESPYIFHFFREPYAFESWITALCNKSIEACNESKERKEDGAICFTGMPISQMAKYIQTKKSMFTGYAIGFNRDLMYKLGARPVIYGDSDEGKELNEKLHWRYVNMDVENNDFSWQREWRHKGPVFDFSEIVRQDAESSEYSNIIVVVPSQEVVLSDEPKMKSLPLQNPDCKYNYFAMNTIGDRYKTDKELQLRTYFSKTVTKK